MLHQEFCGLYVVLGAGFKVFKECQEVFLLQNRAFLNIPA